MPELLVLFAPKQLAFSNRSDLRRTRTKQKPFISSFLRVICAGPGYKALLFCPFCVSERLDVGLWWLFLAFSVCLAGCYGRWRVCCGGVVVCVLVCLGTVLAL